MNLLIDTHVFIWLDSAPDLLSPRAVDLLTDPTVRLWLSAASVWEMAIKVQSGKLAVSGDLAAVVAEQTARNPLHLLPITIAHALAVRSLPMWHRDPFDRMLATQAIAEGATLLTAETVFAHYPVRTEW